MRVSLRVSLVVLLLATPFNFAGSEKYSVKTGKKAPPKELVAGMQELLSDQTIELVKDGKTVAEVWFAKSIPGNAPADKANKTIGYRDLKETSIFGAVQFHTDWQDYRKQPMKAGVYTLRLGFQPQDGDHMGTAPFAEFLILSSPKFDNKADLLTPKALVERSAASINTTHPAVLLLFPNQTPGDKIELASKPNNTWVLNLKNSVATENKGTATLGIGFAIVGHTAE